MAIKSLTTNYVGRTKDISINRGINPRLLPVQPVNLAFGRVSQFCTGVQKLVQRYMISFLTALGSQEDFPTFGTSFLLRLNQGGVTTSDIQHLFNFANMSVGKTFKDYDKLNTVPLDEQLYSASLVSVNVTASSVSLSIKLVCMAGETVDFVLPLPSEN